MASRHRARLWTGARDDTYFLAGTSRDTTLHPLLKAQLAEHRKRDQSSPTARLWRYLDHGRVKGFIFHYEAPMFGWYADFYCLPANLVIEVDGAIHRQRREQDRVRDEAMISRGISVLRIPAAAVRSDIERVVQVIAGVVDTPERRNRRDAIRRLVANSREHDDLTDDVARLMLFAPPPPARRYSYPSRS